MLFLNQESDPDFDKPLDLSHHRCSSTDPFSLALISIVLGSYYLIWNSTHYSWPSLVAWVGIVLLQLNPRTLLRFTHLKPFVHQWTMTISNQRSFVHISGQLGFVEQIKHCHNFVSLVLLVELPLQISSPFWKRQMIIFPYNPWILLLHLLLCLQMPLPILLISLGFVTGNLRVSCISEQIILWPSFMRSKGALGHAKWTSIGPVMVKRNPEKISSKCGL